MINYRYLVLSAFVLAILIGVVFVFFQTTKQGSATLTITSASASPNYNEGINSGYAYTLHINLYIVFKGQMQIYGYAALSVCSFDLELDSSTWESVPITCSLPPPQSLTFSGSHNFSLDYTMVPIDISNVNFTTAFNIYISVFSAQFNVTSQVYFLHINGQDTTVITTTPAQFNNEIKQIIALDYTNKHEFQHKNSFSVNFLNKLIDEVISY